MSKHKFKKSRIINTTIITSLLIVFAVTICIVAHNLSMQKAYQKGVNDAYYDMGNTTSQS